MEPLGAEGAYGVLREALAASYVLERELGRGGMATVYLARDVRHGRAVAVKLLHSELSAALGAQRFLKEIELTASLQHPHILPLFDSGEAGGLLYYVMPYVDGESVRQRLVREGALGVDEAVRIAREVAGALDYAHRHGVIHRDIKPENILLHDGSALVADFGIALAVQRASGARITESGLSLGTPQYMAPEQAMAERAVDARADVFALGVVLYEMLAGEPPFTGPTAQAVVARVMTERPRSLPVLRESVPPHVVVAVMTALEKLPADRYPSAAAFAAALVAPTGPGALPVTLAGRIGPASGTSRRGVLLVGVALAAAAVVGWASASVHAHTSAARGGSEETVRFAIEPDSGAVLRVSGPAVAPDGRTVVFAAEGPGGTRLYLRRVDDLNARALAGTESGEWPFFSPDGAWLGFYADGAIRKLHLDGGEVTLVTEVSSPAVFHGARWGDDDVILLTLLGAGGVYRVPGAGGVATPIAIADSAAQAMSASPLPGGRAALVTIFEGGNGYGMGLLDFASGRFRHLGPGVGARYVRGFVVYASNAGGLYRRRFDLDRLEPTGPEEQLAQDVHFDGDLPSFDVSASGSIVYRVGYPSTPQSARMVLVDRSGREVQAFAARAPWQPRFSPDGSSVAYSAAAPGHDHNNVWVTHLVAGTTQRITSDAQDNSSSAWSADGRMLLYDGLYPGTNKDLFVQTLDGGAARRMTSRREVEWADDWSPDGSALLFTDVRPPLAYDLWVQPMDGSAAHPYLASAAQESGARFSPDGQWVAYTSNETGRDEVYVQSYPTPGRKVLVSTAGGAHPVWRRDGRELYYWREDQLIAASLSPAAAGDPPAVRGRTLLFRAPYVHSVSVNYDVSPDGTRFVVVIGRVHANRLVVALHAVPVGTGDSRRR